jgi:hypothetical protein
MTYKVKNWKKFQHFKDRRPPWIKLYRDLLDDLEWFELDATSSKHLINLWLIASEYEGKLPSIEILCFRLRLKKQEVTSILSKLSHWLEQDDINVTSEVYQDDSTETETETETERKILSIPIGVSESLWNEFINYRKKLKAPVTETVLKRLTKEANLANMEMNEVISTIIFKGWKSFEADWIKKEQPKQKVDFI